MRVHVINLDRSADRWSEFSSLNRHLTDVARFSAVDGQTLDVARLARDGLASEDVLSSYSKGALGVALSHITLWDRAIRDGETLTVAEDDAIFNAHYEACAAEVIKALPSDWDLIVWGWNFDLFFCFDVLPGVSTCLAQFEQDRLRQGIASFQAQQILPRPFRLVWAFGIPCYTITPKGAQALRRSCLPLRPRLLQFPLAQRAPPHAAQYRTVGIDVLMNLAYAELRAFASFPPLAVTKNETDRSTVQQRS